MHGHGQIMRRGSRKNSSLSATLFVGSSTNVSATMAAAQADKGFEVLVIGGGLAGLAAAFEAAQSPHTKVTLIDKEAKVGGNSAKATSGINGVGMWTDSTAELLLMRHPASLAGTAAQSEQKVDDSVEEFSKDTHASGHNLCDASLVDMLSTQSAAAVAFLTSHGKPPRQPWQCSAFAAGCTQSRHRYQPE